MEKEYIFSFERLEVWQESKSLIKDVYQLLKKFPSKENYALTDQVRRSIVSVASNIAESSGRMSPKEKVHFFEIAFGSLMECFCQLLIAYELGYITNEEITLVRKKFGKISKMLSGLRTHFLNH